MIPGGVDAGRHAHGAGGAAMRKIKELCNGSPLNGVS